MKNTLLLLTLLLTALLFTACRKSVKTDIITPVTDNKISNVEKIEKAETDKISYGNNLSESGIKDVAVHSGQFDVSMSGYKGELFIGIDKDKFYGTIKFFNWGNGVPQPLINLKVTDDKIYFKREIKTKEDLIKYGGTAFFEQEFYGIFSADRKTVKGYYRYLGTQDNWEALKKD